MSSILVVGAGELGTSVLQALALSPKRPQPTQITVLLRPETLASPTPAKKQSIDEIKSLGVEIQSGDFIAASISELANIFKPFDIVIQCAGYGMPKGTQVKVTQAALQAKVPRFFPWQFGLDFDRIPEANYGGMFDDNKLVRKLLREQHDRGFDRVVHVVLVSPVVRRCRCQEESSEGFGKLGEQNHNHPTRRHRQDGRRGGICSFEGWF